MTEAKPETRRDSGPARQRAPERRTLKDRLKHLYAGDSNEARAFRFGILAFDIVTVIFFIATSLVENEGWVFVIDGIIALIILTDLAARFYIADQPSQLFMRLTTWLDIIVIVTLLLPMFLSNLLFLRVIRSLRILQSYRVIKDLREVSPYFKRNQEVIESAIHLGIFIFIMTALVYVFQVRTNDQINNYFDALYFTVTALTTTGFGDVTLQGPGGRILAVVIMIVGVGLFLRVVQTIFRPTRVRHSCPDCGLNRHEADAIHCRHCGRVLNIPNEGLD
jgi:voltage-gated potassium channel